MLLIACATEKVPSGTFSVLLMKTRAARTAGEHCRCAATTKLYMLWMNQPEPAVGDQPLEGDPLRSRVNLMGEMG